MNVLVVNYEHPPQGGGAGVVMRNLALEIGQLGVHQTMLFGWDPRYGEPEPIPGGRLLPIVVKRLSLGSTGLRAVFEFLYKAARALKQLDLSSTDLVHFHFSVPTGVLRKRIKGAPYICSLHGIDVPDFVPEEARWVQRLMSPINRQVMRNAAAVVAPSQAIANAVLRWEPSARVKVIPHGVDVKGFRSKSVYSATAKKFVCVSRLTSWKRVDIAIRAVATLSRQGIPVSLDIYGDGEQRKTLAKLIQDLKADSFINLHGFVSKQTLAEALPTFDAFVFPSISEAFGLVILEAMAAGLPVVAARTCGPEEIVRDGETGILVDPDSELSLTTSLQKLSLSKGLAEQLGRRARSVAEQSSWDNTAAKYVALYSAVVKTADAHAQS